MAFAYGRQDLLVCARGFQEEGKVRVGCGRRNPGPEGADRDRERGNCGRASPDMRHRNGA